MSAEQEATNSSCEEGGSKGGREGARKRGGRKEGRQTVLCNVRNYICACGFITILST